MNWHHVAATGLINQHRKGWRGVWDAIVAALKGDDRISVPQPLTVEVWLELPEKPLAFELRSADERLPGQSMFIDGVRFGIEDIEGRTRTCPVCNQTRLKGGMHKGLDGAPCSGLRGDV